MADKSLELKLETAEAERKVSDLEAKVARLEDRLRSLGSALNTNGETGAPAGMQSASRASANVGSSAAPAMPVRPNSAQITAQAAGMGPAPGWAPQGYPGAGGWSTGNPPPYTGAQPMANAQPFAAPLSGMPISVPATALMMTGINGSAVASALNAQLQYQTERVRMGGYDAMGQAGIVGRLGGTVIGGIIGSFGGPVTAAAGAAIGGGIMETASRYMAAGLQNRLDAVGALSVLSEETNQRGILGGAGSPWRRAIRVGGIIDDVNSGMAGNDPRRFAAGGGAVAATAFVSLSESLMAGGINPFTPVGSRVYGPSAASLQSDLERIRSGQAGTAGASALAGADLIRALGGGREQAGEQYFRRLATLYKGNIDAGVKQVGDIFSTLPETGGNTADILMRYGPARTLSFEKLQDDRLEARDSLSFLLTANSNIRTGQRLTQLGSLQIRGSGLAASVALRGELADIANIPGGKDSLTYATERQRLAGYLTQAGQQSDMVQFGIPGVQIQGAMNRAQVLPYMPSNMYALGARQIVNNTGQINAIRSRMQTMRSAGLLSEESEMQMTSQIEGLRTETARDFAMISEGRENLIPGLVAGRGRHAGSFDSFQLAALSYGRGNLPYRGYGAMNGAQLAMQNAYSDLVSGGMLPQQPYSRTAGLNNGAPGGSGDIGQLADLLAKILQTLQGGSMQGQRNNGAIGQLDGAVSTRNMGQGNVKANRGYQ